MKAALSLRLIIKMLLFLYMDLGIDNLLLDILLFMFFLIKMEFLIKMKIF